MHLLIVGAGVGGLAAAAGLARDGHRVTLLEAADGLRQGGAGVTIASNGHAALAGLGVASQDLGGRIDDLVFRLANGHRIARVDLRVVARRTGLAFTTVPRAHLVTRLAAHLPDGVLHLGRRVSSVTVHASGVEVGDALGGTWSADLLVGADGHGSVVRRATVSPVPAADAGWITWQGLTPVLPDLADGTQGLCLVGPAGLCGLMPAGGGLLQWWFDVRSAAGRAAGDRRIPTPGTVLAWLRARFGDYADPVPRLLAGIAEPDLGAYPHVLHALSERWGTGPTTLVGDAAHAFPPSQAQGANQALEDAWLLTRTLGRPGAPAELLRRYEQLRTRRVRRVSRLAATQVTNQAPGRWTAGAAAAVPARLAGLVYLAQLRRWSSVLTQESP